MKDSLKLVTLGLAVVCIVPFIISSHDQIYEKNEIENLNHNCNKTDYLLSYNFSQKSIKLDQEFIQYKIKFFKNATVNYDYFLKFRVKDLHPIYYFIIFTDGKNGVMEREFNGKLFETPIMGHSMIPLGILLDINLLKIHISIGQLLFKLLPIGDMDNINGRKTVKAGTEWFLTICVYNSNIDDIFYINLVTDKPSFQVIELDRSNKIEYFNSVNGDFEGFYSGIKILSRGVSYSKNLKKTITTTKGSLIIFTCIGHLNGEINVVNPEGNIFSKNSRHLASFQYYGNQTGTWKFSSSGLGFGRKHIVSLFYIDADPHFYLSDFEN